MEKLQATELCFCRRRLDGELPRHWEPGIHWQVECHLADGRDLPFPLGVVWVSDFASAGNVDFVSLDYLLVADQFRRCGVGTALVAECRRLWPNIWLTEAISEAGAGLLVRLGEEKEEC